jgi:hypothetical protein
VGATTINRIASEEGHLRSGSQAVWQGSTNAVVKVKVAERIFKVRVASPVTLWKVTICIHTVVGQKTNNP